MVWNLRADAKKLAGGRGAWTRLKLSACKRVGLVMRDSRLGLSDRYLMRQPLWFGRCIGHGAAAEARADAGRSGLLV